MAATWVRTGAHRAAISRCMKKIWKARQAAKAEAENVVAAAARVEHLAGKVAPGWKRKVNTLTTGAGGMVVSLNYSQDRWIDALTPVGAPEGLNQDQKDIWDAFERQKVKALKKNMDYGSSVFEEPVLAPGLGKTAAIQVRMSDKIKRLGTLLQAGAKAQVADESVVDTMGDLAVYALLWIIGRRREQETEKLRADYEVFMAKEKAKGATA